MPISIEKGEKAGSLCTFESHANESLKLSPFTLEICYKILSDNYPGLMKYQYRFPELAIKKKTVDIKTNFPSIGVKFHSSSFSIEILNLGHYPIDAILSIKDSPNFLIEGILSNPVALFPSQPLSISWKFFPVAHGTLKFPLIMLSSSESSSSVIWQIEPSIFVTFSEAT